MRHDRRGLTVLSLLIILIVVALLIVILLRARTPADQAVAGPDSPVPTAPEATEGAFLTTLVAPDSAVRAGGADTVGVRLTNTAGTPMVGVTVTFAVTAGGGSVAPDTVRTDSSGTAIAVWTYGATPGINSLRIAADVPRTIVEPLLLTVEAGEAGGR